MDNHDLASGSRPVNFNKALSDISVLRLNSALKDSTLKITQHYLQRRPKTRELL